MSTGNSTRAHDESIDAFRTLGCIFQRNHPTEGHSEENQTPRLEALEAGFVRLRLELERDYEALDHDSRNHALEAELPDEHEQLAARFVWLYASESFAELFERTESRFKRRHALITLELVAKRLAAGWDRSEG